VFAVLLVIVAVGPVYRVRSCGCRFGGVLAGLRGRYCEGVLAGGNGNEWWRVLSGGAGDGAAGGVAGGEPGTVFDAVLVVAAGW
jgi:hypothetical protein